MRDRSGDRKISDGPSDLAAAEAAGAHVNVLRGTVHDGLDALHIGLPHAVAAPVGMADLDAKGDTLVAEFTLCHACCTSSSINALPKGQLIYNTRPFRRLQDEFSFSRKNFKRGFCVAIGTGNDYNIV